MGTPLDPDWTSGGREGPSELPERKVLRGGRGDGSRRVPGATGLQRQAVQSRHGGNASNNGDTRQSGKLRGFQESSSRCSTRRSARIEPGFP